MNTTPYKVGDLVVIELRNYRNDPTRPNGDYACRVQLALPPDNPYSPWRYRVCPLKRVRVTLKAGQRERLTRVYAQPDQETVMVFHDEIITQLTGDHAARQPV